jgi:hypothetical protein
VTETRRSLRYSMVGGHHDPRSDEEFAAALWRETDASLRREPERWESKRSDQLPARSGNNGAQQVAASRARWTAGDGTVPRICEQRIIELLGAGTRTPAELRDALSGFTVGTVRGAVYRLRSRGVIEKTGWSGSTTWRLVEPPPS